MSELRKDGFMFSALFRASLATSAVLLPALAPLQAYFIEPPEHHATQVQSELEHAAQTFQITEHRFQSFRQIARLRRLHRAEILPGFPENPCLDCGVAELRRDRPARPLLARAHLTSRDYVLTGWALALARAPADWGLDERQLPAATQRNVAFVRAHLAEVDALLNGD